MADSWRNLVGVLGVCCVGWCPIGPEGMTIAVAETPPLGSRLSEETAPLVTPLVRVAIYDHSDGSANGPRNLLSFLTEEHGFQAQKVTPEQIRSGVLDHCDVLIMPGGSGSKQAEMLESAGRDRIRDFVRRGGGYVGICAGSYLATTQYDWSLGLVNARVWDRAHWARGTGQVELSLTPSGQRLLNSEQGQVHVYYGQGPLLVPDQQPHLPGYEVLGSYQTEVALKGAPAGAMTGTHAIVRTLYGQGRVICFSPHPEVTNGPRHLMSAAIHWAATGEQKD